MPVWKTIFWTEFWQVFTEFNRLLIFFSWMKFSFVCALRKLKQLVLESKENTNHSCTLLTRSSLLNITGKLKLRSDKIVSPEENTQHLTEHRLRTKVFGLPQRLNFQVISWLCHAHVGYYDDLSEILAFRITVCGTQAVQQISAWCLHPRKKIKT